MILGIEVIAKREQPFWQLIISIYKFLMIKNKLHSLLVGRII